MLNFSGTLARIVTDISVEEERNWDYTIEKFGLDLSLAFKENGHGYVELRQDNSHNTDGTVDGHIRTLRSVDSGMCCSYYGFKASSREVIEPEITVEWCDQKLCVVIKPKVGAPKGMVSPITEIVRTKTKMVEITHPVITIYIPQPTLVLLHEANSILENFFGQEIARIKECIKEITPTPKPVQV